MADNRKIAVSKLSPNYENWLKKIDSTVELINLYPEDISEALRLAGECSALLLTGGSDVHPSRYGKENYLPFCLNIDEKRDELELILIKAAFENKLPILGICRGLQILNIAFKGTLIPDIHTTIPHSGTEDVYHRVNMRKKSHFFNMTGVSTEIVNSSHHQGIDVIAKVFNPVVHSPDAVIEAIEADPSVHPFCIAVQWHPERMELSNPLSWKLGVKFLDQMG